MFKEGCVVTIIIQLMLTRLNVLGLLHPCFSFMTPSSWPPCGTLVLGVKLRGGVQGGKELANLFQTFMAQNETAYK